MRELHVLFAFASMRQIEPSNCLIRKGLCHRDLRLATLRGQHILY
jgi:hypothetical protein